MATAKVAVTIDSAVLDPDVEKAMAEEGMGRELDHWPEY